MKRTATEMVERGGRMVEWELEAAEALAGLAGFSASLGGAAISGELKRLLVTQYSQEKSHKTMAVDKFHDGTSTRITTSPEKIEKIIKKNPNPNHSRGRICLQNSVNKSRSKLTEGEKQERMARRIMANREAARETIRRRQAMFMELNKKAVDASDENEYLKKEKELAVAEYHSLKCRNELLKAKLANSKKPITRDHMQVDPKASRAEKTYPKASRADKTYPKASRAEKIYPWHNHPSMVPCIWPPIIPPSDAFKFQCAGPHSHEMGPSHFPMIVYPMPWLLPFFAHGHTPHSQSGMSTLSSFEDSGHLSKANTSSSNKSIATGLTSQSESHVIENTARYPDGTVYVPGLFSPVKPQERPVGPARNDVGRQQLYKEMEYIYDAAAEARKRRKELMKMKNVSTRHQC
ncbi:hypothetical protein CASFOL_027376 [Castilleja foliolosa]|uniref:BZIP domain-containing protein n=1 Tax=Castilleja foliolosa TaxID=1961234 RepID=A0ABD3CHT6_9LAMI